MSDKEKTYTVAEERLNISTHAIGIACGLAVSAIFIKTVVEKGGDAWSLASIILYAFGMLSSYIFSTLYHASRPGTTARRWLRKLDHSAIYWHIAGSYSPLMLVVRSGGHLVESCEAEEA